MGEKNINSIICLEKTDIFHVLYEKIRVGGRAEGNGATFVLLQKSATIWAFQVGLDSHY